MPWLIWFDLVLFRVGVGVRQVICFSFFLWSEKKKRKRTDLWMLPNPREATQQMVKGSSSVNLTRDSLTPSVALLATVLTLNFLCFFERKFVVNHETLNVFH